LKYPQQLLKQSTSLSPVLQQFAQVFDKPRGRTGVPLAHAPPPAHPPPNPSEVMTQSQRSSLQAHVHPLLAPGFAQASPASQGVVRVTTHVGALDAQGLPLGKSENSSVRGQATAPSGAVASIRREESRDIPASEGESEDEQEQLIA